MSAVVSVFLSVPQMKKAANDKTFQLSKTNIGKTPNAKIELVTKVLANRYEKAKSANKGFRFSATMYKLIEGEGMEATEGGKLTFKKVVKALKPYAKMAGKKAVNVVGNWLDKNTGLKDGEIDSLKNSANLAIDGKSKKALQELKQTGDEIIKGQIDRIDAGIDEEDATDGKGLKRKSKFVKGSQEAKDFMRMLREKRSAKSGTGIIKDIKKEIKSVAKMVLKKGKKPMLDAVKAGLTAGLMAGSTEAGLTPIPGVLLANHLNKKIDKKFGNGVAPAYDREPNGAGRYTLLNKIRPELFVNKGALPTHGGSFRAPGMNGGSFDVYHKGGSFLQS